MPHNIERLETPSSGPHCQVLRCPNALVCTAGSSPKSSITAFCDHDAQLSLSGTCTELRRLLLTCGRPQYDGTRVINRTQRMKGIHSMEVLSMLPFPATGVDARVETVQDLQDILSVTAGVGRPSWEDGLAADPASLRSISIFFMDSENPKRVPFPLAALFSECKLTGLERMDLNACDPRKHVHLTGTLTEVAMHSSLTNLSLSGCKGVTGDLSSLASLTALTILEFSKFKSLTGNLSSMAPLTALTTIKFTDCNAISGNLTSLGSNASLTHLELSCCNGITNDISASLVPLKNLRYFEICGGIFGHLSMMAPLTVLTTLILEESGFVGDLASLSTLTALTTLKLSQDHLREDDEGGTDEDSFSGSLSSLAPLVSLTYLDLYECIGIVGDLASLAPLSALTDLNLHHSIVGGHLSSLAHLHGLTSLLFADCEGISGHVAALAPLTDLNSLYILSCDSVVLEGCPHLQLELGPSLQLSDKANEIAQEVYSWIHSTAARFLEDNLSHAEAMKAEGNKAFAKKKYRVAIRLYSEAVALDASNHLYYSNRSACYAEEGKFGEAKEDGEMCIKLKPGFVKGYLRKANAEYLMEELDAAVVTIREGLKKDAKFSELTKLLLMVKAGKKKAASTRDKVKVEAKNSATMGSAEKVNVLTAAFSKKITDAFEKATSKMPENEVEWVAAAEGFQVCWDGMPPALEAPPKNDNNDEVVNFFEKHMWPMWQILSTMVGLNSTNTSGSPPGCFKALQASWTSSFDKNSRCFHQGLSNASRVLGRIGWNSTLNNLAKLGDLQKNETHEQLHHAPWVVSLELLLDVSQKAYRSIAIEDERHDAAPEPPNELWLDVLGAFLEEGGFWMLAVHLNPKAFDERAPDKQVKRGIRHFFNTNKQIAQEHFFNIKVALILKRLVTGIRGSGSLALGSVRWVKDIGQDAIPSLEAVAATMAKVKVLSDGVVLWLKKAIDRSPQNTPLSYVGGVFQINDGKLLDNLMELMDFEVSMELAKGFLNLPVLSAQHQGLRLVRSLLKAQKSSSNSRDTGAGAGVVGKEEGGGAAKGEAAATGDTGTCRGVGVEGTISAVAASGGGTGAVVDSPPAVFATLPQDFLASLQERLCGEGDALVKQLLAMKVVHKHSIVNTFAELASLMAMQDALAGVGTGSETNRQLLHSVCFFWGDVGLRCLRTPTESTRVVGIGLLELLFSPECSELYHFPLEQLLPNAEKALLWLKRMCMLDMDFPCEYEEQQVGSSIGRSPTHMRLSATKLDVAGLKNAESVSPLC